MVVRFAKLTLGFLVGLVAGYALSVMRPEAADDQVTEEFQ